MFVVCVVSDVYGKLKTLSLVKENHLQEVEEEQPQEEIEEDPATEMSVWSFNKKKKFSIISIVIREN